MAFFPDYEIRVGLESHLVALQISTTGPQSNLSTVGNQYKRSSGSFVTDGFQPGDAVHATGFTGTANGLSTVTAVAALALTVNRALPTQAAGSSRTIYAGVPVVSFPGQPFTLPTDGAWVRPRVGNAGQRVVGVRETNIQRHEGIFIIDVFQPYDSGMGMVRLERLSGAIREHFRITTSIARPSLTIRISGMSPGSLLEESDFLHMPVGAFFWSDVAGL